MDKLGRACLPPTVAGVSNIKRIKRDKLPLGVNRWPLDPKLLPSIVEEPSVSRSSYIQPGTDVFEQPCHNPSITHDMITVGDQYRQNMQDARRSGIIQGAVLASVQARDCRQVSSIPRRTDPEDDDSSSD